MTTDEQTTDGKWKILSFCYKFIAMMNNNTSPKLQMKQGEMSLYGRNNSYVNEQFI